MTKYFLCFFVFVLVLIAGTVAATRGIWSSKPPITVSFHAEVEKPVDIEIKWANAAHAPFRAEVGVFRKVTPADREVVVELPTRKVYRFRVDAGSYPGHVTLSKLQLRCGDKVVSFDDFNQFSYYNIENKSIEPGKLKLFSQHLDPYFEYQLPLEVVKTRRIDWFALGIICILSVLLASVVVNTVRYAMAGRSMMEWKHAAFCSLFCGLLIIPVIKLDQRDILPEENRRMSTFPNALNAEEGGVNYNFGKQFESWLQDRFTGRRSFIKRYDTAMSYINGRIENNVGILYPNGWMFYKPWTGKIFRTPAETELVRITRNLQRVQKFCDEQGIKFYTLICPVKEDIYARFHTTGRASGTEANTELVKYVNRVAPQIKIVYPRELMAKHAMTATLYYKTDTHQNEDGAYLLNAALVKELQKDIPSVPMPEKEKFVCKRSKQVGVGRELNNGYIYWVMGIKDTSVLDVEYPYYILPDTSVLKVDENDLRERHSVYQIARGGKCILLGDSFTENQALWLQYSFRELHKWRCNNGLENNEMRFERWTSRIREEKPDVLVFCVSASDCFWHLNNLYKD
ncbi:MAG: hypothetical protein IKA23_05385 [Akkermansia sp.]|nr:hypothetical protein [Akkermansia sp.]